MLTVVKQNSQGEITGWMMGADMPALRRRAEAAFDQELAGLFYRMEFAPPHGKHQLAPGVTLLVDG